MIWIDRSERRLRLPTLKKPSSRCTGSARITSGSRPEAWTATSWLSEMSSRGSTSANCSRAMQTRGRSAPAKQLLPRKKLWRGRYRASQLGSSRYPSSRTLGTSTVYKGRTTTSVAAILSPVTTRSAELEAASFALTSLGAQPVLALGLGGSAGSLLITFVCQRLLN